jgi:hypothetical protein
MTKDQILDDLHYARNLAEQGANTPLLGGRIGLMWGCLLVPTLLIHGLTLMGIVPMPQPYIGLIWLTFGLGGGLLTWILGRGLDDKPGANSVINRIEQATWTAATLMIFGLAIGVSYSVLMMSKPYWLYDVIMAAAFGTYVINYYVLAKLSGLTRLYIPMLMAFVLMVVIVVNVGQPWIYVLAAFGVLLTAVIPALISLKNEPKNA